jgi:hypothetical protein
MLTPALRFLEHAKTTSRVSPGRGLARATRDLLQRSELTQVAASRLPPYRFPQDVRPPTHTDCRPIPGLEGVRLHLADHVLPLWHAVQIETHDPDPALRTGGRLDSWACVRIENEWPLPR